MRNVENGHIGVTEPEFCHETDIFRVMYKYFYIKYKYNK